LTHGGIAIYSIESPIEGAAVSAEALAMPEELLQVACEVEIKPGERLTLPPALVERVGAGRWIVTVQSAAGTQSVRLHDAFLHGYAPEDEGLYDDYPSR